MSELEIFPRPAEPARPASGRRQPATRSCEAARQHPQRPPRRKPRRQGTGGAASQAAAPAASPPSTPESRSAAALALSADPVFDEGTYQRIKEALLSYAAIQVRGGWPAIPADAKLAPGASGPEVALLRKRLVISDDLRARARSRRQLRRGSSSTRSSTFSCAMASRRTAASARRPCARSMCRSPRGSSSSKLRSNACSAWISSLPNATWS